MKTKIMSRYKSFKIDMFSYQEFIFIKRKLTKCNWTKTKLYINVTFDFSFRFISWGKATSIFVFCVKRTHRAENATSHLSRTTFAIFICEPETKNTFAHKLNSDSDSAEPKQVSVRPETVSVFKPVFFLVFKEQKSAKLLSGLLTERSCHGVLLGPPPGASLDESDSSLRGPRAAQRGRAVLVQEPRPGGPGSGGTPSRGGAGSRRGCGAVGAKALTPEGPQDGQSSGGQTGNQSRPGKVSDDSVSKLRWKDVFF